MCTYINFCRTSLPTADSKCQISYRQSKNGSECTSLCAPKLLQEVNFPKSFLSSCIQDGLQLCTYVSTFLCGVRWCHNRAPNLEPRFLVNFVFSYQFEEGQRRQLYIDLDAVFAVCWRTRCAQQCTKRFVVPSVGGATRFANLRRKFSKTQKKSAAELCQILCTVTVETVINSTRVMGVCVTISCWYALSLMGRCFCFQFFSVCHAPSPEHRALEGCIVRTSISLPFIARF